MWMGMIRPTDVEAMSAQAKSVSSRALMHFCEFGFNMRNPPLDNFNFRHALAHLVPKEKIIGTLFKYIDIKIDTPVPPSQGLWYNPYVDPHPYSPAEAESILTQAGFTKVGGVYTMPGGGAIPGVRVYCPLEITAPTSYTIARMFVDEATAIGLSSLHLEPMDFATYTDLAFNDWDFDIFWVCWSLGRFPEQLYSKFHSSQLYLGSYNCYGINWPDLDEQIEIFYFGMDHAAKVVAVKTAQEMLMGGPSYPLGYNMDPNYQALPLLCVYSRNAYDTQNNQLRGAINMFGYGIENSWTWMNVYWNTANEYRPGTSQKIVVPIMDEFSERLNPTFASTVYAWNVMGDCFDGLLATNPYTLRDEEWLATSWSYGVEEQTNGTHTWDGMWVKFTVRTTDSEGAPIKWQDGVNIDLQDAVFSWDFLHDKAIPRYYASMSHYYNNTSDYPPEIVGNEITAHMDTPSQWMLYDLAGNAYLLPEAVWGPWVDDATSDILSWDPSQEAGPAGLPTKVYGTGPFILQHNTIQIGQNGYSDHIANRNYWMTTTGIQNLITAMFHSAGDVNRDGVDNVGDLSAIGLAYDSTPASELHHGTQMRMFAVKPELLQTK